MGIKLNQTEFYYNCFETLSVFNVVLKRGQLTKIRVTSEINNTHYNNIRHIELTERGLIYFLSVSVSKRLTFSISLITLKCQVSTELLVCRKIYQVLKLPIKCFKQQWHM